MTRNLIDGWLFLQGGLVSADGLSPPSVDPLWQANQARLPPLTPLIPPAPFFVSCADLTEINSRYTSTLAVRRAAGVPSLSPAAAAL